MTPPLKSRLDRFRRANAGRFKSDTEAEHQLWLALRDLPLEGSHFRRQVRIGPYTVDFACLAARLIIEVDGEYHREPDQGARDAERSAWLEAEGYRVLRFGNDTVATNLGAVLDAVQAAIFGAEGPRPLLHTRSRSD